MTTRRSPPFLHRLFFRVQLLSVLCSSSAINPLHPCLKVRVIDAKVTARLEQERSGKKRLQGEATMPTRNRYRKENRTSGNRKERNTKMLLCFIFTETRGDAAPCKQRGTRRDMRTEKNRMKRSWERGREKSKGPALSSGPIPSFRSLLDRLCRLGSSGRRRRRRSRGRCRRRVVLAYSGLRR